MKGDENIVRCLLEYNAKVNVADQNGQSPLMKAIEGGHTSCVDLLINYHADLTARDSCGNAPIHQAVKFGHRNITKRLLCSGVGINSHNQVRFNSANAILRARVLPRGRPPSPSTLAVLYVINYILVLLCYIFHYSMEKHQSNLLLNVSITKCWTFSLRKVLNWIALTRRESEPTYICCGRIPKLFLKFGYSFRSALMMACELGDSKIAELLISCGANTDLRDKHGM